jgi:E3 ubiquitin-protein ligase UBR4
MTFLATISYRKACSLKHLTDFGGEQLSFSDSTTYYNDTLSCSDESDTEEEEDGKIFYFLILLNF